MVHSARLVMLAMPLAPVLSFGQGRSLWQGEVVRWRWRGALPASVLRLALLFTWFFFRGVTGTLAWHRLDREDSRAAAVTAAPVPAPRFRTREEYHAWKEQHELERAGNGRC